MNLHPYLGRWLSSIFGILTYDQHRAQGRVLGIPGSQCPLCSRNKGRSHGECQVRWKITEPGKSGQWLFSRPEEEQWEQEYCPISEDWESSVLSLPHSLLWVYLYVLCWVTQGRGKRALESYERSKTIPQCLEQLPKTQS